MTDARPPTASSHGRAANTPRSTRQATDGPHAGDMQDAAGAPEAARLARVHSSYIRARASHRYALLGAATLAVGTFFVVQAADPDGAHPLAIAALLLAVGVIVQLGVFLAKPAPWYAR